MGEHLRHAAGNGGLKCRDLVGDAYTEAMLEKHVWICAFMLVGALNGGITVGEVEKEHSEQLKAVVTELARRARRRSA